MFIIIHGAFCSHIYAQTTTQVFAKYKNNVFIETGSYLGDGIQQALDAGFTRIHSIELSPKYYQHCTRRFAKNKNVTIWFGDSSKLLGSVLNQIQEPVTFWLDGHCSLGNTAKGEMMTPLMRELEIIKNHPIKNHTIIIDDIRCCNTFYFDFLSLKSIVSKINEINPEYEIIYEDVCEKNDVLVARIRK